MPVFLAFLIAWFIPISAPINPIALSASMLVTEEEIFLTIIFGFGLITFFLILLQYEESLANPWEGAPTNSALIIASAQTLEWIFDKPCFKKI